MAVRNRVIYHFNENYNIENQKRSEAIYRCSKSLQLVRSLPKIFLCAANLEEKNTAFSQSQV